MPIAYTQCIVKSLWVNFLIGIIVTKLSCQLLLLQTPSRPQISFLSMEKALEREVLRQIIQPNSGVPKDGFLLYVKKHSKGYPEYF